VPSISASSFRTASGVSGDLGGGTGTLADIVDVPGDAYGDGGERAGSCEGVIGSGDAPVADGFSFLIFLSTMVSSSLR
jgi:hypothetical protein